MSEDGSVTDVTIALPEPGSCMEVLFQLAQTHPQIADRVSQVWKMEEPAREERAQQVLEALWSAL